MSLFYLAGESSINQQISVTYWRFASQCCCQILSSGFVIVNLVLYHWLANLSCFRQFIAVCCVSSMSVLFLETGQNWHLLSVRLSQRMRPLQICHVTQPCCSCAYKIFQFFLLNCLKIFINSPLPDVAMLCAFSWLKDELLDTNLTCWQNPFTSTSLEIPCRVSWFVKITQNNRRWFYLAKYFPWSCLNCFYICFLHLHVYTYLDI